MRQDRKEKNRVSPIPAGLHQQSRCLLYPGASNLVSICVARCQLLEWRASSDFGDLLGSRSAIPTHPDPPDARGAFAPPLQRESDTPRHDVHSVPTTLAGLGFVTNQG